MEEINIIEITQLEGALGGVAGVARQAENALGSLDSKLLTLRLNFGKLRSSLERAFAPITSHVAVALNGLVRQLTAWVNDAGAIIGALFGTVQKKAVTTAARSGKALRRSLAAFDEIDRLDAGSGSGSTPGTVTWETITPELTPQLQRIVDAIRAILAPLQAISFDRAKAALASLGAAMARLGAIIGDSLSWAWFNILTPLAKWTVEAAAPAAIDALTAAFSLLSAILQPVLAGIRALLPALQPVVGFIGDTAILTLAALKTQLEKLAAAFTQNSAGLSQVLIQLSGGFSAMLAGVKPIFTALRDSWLAVMDAMGSAAAATVSALTAALNGLTEFLSGAFTGNWQKAWAGVKDLFKGFVNGLIALVNGMLSGLVGGINAAVKALNRLRLTLPKWLPGVGGETFGVSIPTLTVPQIPYLAKGAVLPANRPFLAMVGDQRNGTNIEAPLATIQEAVAAVLLPGQNEQNQLLAQLLTAVSGIRVGDETIGRAAERYQRQLLRMGGA